MSMNGTLKERFWKNVRKTAGCWEWRGSNNGRGYGRIMFNRQRTLAHRLAWQFSRGAIPPDMSVLHTCDNPGCVNPDHLFLGTQTDNMIDAAHKGRLRNQFSGKKGEA